MRKYRKTNVAQKWGLQLANPPRNLTSPVVAAHPAPLTPDPMLGGLTNRAARCNTDITSFLFNIGVGGGRLVCLLPQEVDGRGKGQTKKNCRWFPRCWTDVLTASFACVSERSGGVVYENGGRADNSDNMPASSKSVAGKGDLLHFSAGRGEVKFLGGRRRFSLWILAVRCLAPFCKNK